MNSKPLTGTREYTLNKILKTLKNKYKLEKKVARPFRVAFKILITTILSQRTKDEITDEVSTQLFLKYKSPEDFATLPARELERLIKKTGFYRVKAKRIKEISKILISQFNSKVPQNIEDLLSLPGVGRKTANCVLAYGFGISALPVDTHVHRISNRLGLVETKTPEETEKALQIIIPKNYWGWLNTALVSFGKEICKPVKPKCEICELNKICHFKAYQKIRVSVGRVSEDQNIR